MVQQVLGGVAEDLSIQGCDDVSEAQSTFDRLLRAYFARLLIREIRASNRIDPSFELPAPPSGHSLSK
ncbi:hypothetical protein [Bradyrhizobium sp. CCBAU 45389]|uniref:hypothetical protein n=1 Tax=Bradyrhizobium sp. CCBAU 45389 TaxID=858429 RepID=UPI002305927D|nr:hypothetical protein [Bradyrhizobium sp. CCBAU 45389]MDA9400766.1 hypothetical protein [Bradyrhizobium sp. CCBAU 45389]